MIWHRYRGEHGLSCADSDDGRFTVARHRVGTGEPAMFLWALTDRTEGTQEYYQRLKDVAGVVADRLALKREEE